MSKADALRAARRTMASGYNHHSYFDALTAMEAALKSGSPGDMGISLATYADVLAPTRLRGMKNGLICLVTLISRAAIEHGVDNELSFALSDYYINATELQGDEAQLDALMGEMVALYLGLIAQEKGRAYSLPVTRAVRYIRLNVYGTCRVSQVAAHVGLNPQYLAVLFKKETGISPSKFIAQARLEQARLMLRQTGCSVTEAAEALGYCNPSHFIKEYRAYYGVTPKRHVFG